MTGKQLSEDHRAILSRLLQISKLNNHEIAWVLGVDERTVRRRRYEFAATGEIKKHKDVSKNAEKLKPDHLEKLVDWHKDHPDALLDDMQLFLRTQCGLEVSLPTISRQIRKAYGGTFLRSGRCARIRSRKQREAEGRSIALELQQQNTEDAENNSSGQAAAAAAPEMYHGHDQRQLAPIEQLLAPQHGSPPQEQGTPSQSADGQQHYQDRQQLRYELDLNSWNLRIWGVAASGFLTDSYNLFASNVILSTVSFVYFPHDRWCGLVINLFTLFGSVLGQLLFGYLADRYGRTRLYGIELVLVIVSTIGVATTSNGYGDISFLALFTWWRFVMGVGIGAEYPLSAVITSEWASTSSRTTMMSSVFLMQPVGQALAQIVGVWVLLGEDAAHGLHDKQCGLDLLHAEECKKIIDGTWRIVIGSGAVPALLAIIFRFFLYDCGLYTLEVKNKPGNAFRDTQRVYGPPPVTNGISMSSTSGAGGGGGGGGTFYEPETMPQQFSLKDLHTYFIKDKNWYYLLGTSMTWFFLDVSFYGFSLDNRGTLADLWATTRKVPINEDLWCWNSTLPGGTSLVPSWLDGVPNWQTDRTQPCNTIYQTIIEQTKQYLLTVSLASIAGSACFIIFANRIHRRRWLTTSFLVLTLLFLVTGGVYYGVAHTSGSPATVVCVAICHFMFNFGANTLTFMIPAEIFPTSYRCTCHGISAAAGKLGSIVAVVVVYGINSGYVSATRQGLIFLLFATFMALGAVFSWAYLPDVQRVVYVDSDAADGHGVKKLENMNLEELGEGYMRAGQEGQVIGLSEKWADLKGRVRRRRRSRRVEVGTVPLPGRETPAGAATATGPVEVEGNGIVIP
ncbi:major facilitator superfamily domain-containing protein [Chaetomidium leptoderma]|uniref:Major facilitator superfamily domain-containing protein n=1 Tax=Chaetomidium leptoderma TaxID=669021 RepID=A0AAN6ZZX1_9PEZI|nr:major facilitator superfamily domain-containing protein [Chaetomidium leptoderma]